MGRVWYHLRVRELVSPGKWIKKSKFYLVRKPGDAVKKYTERARRKGNGSNHTIMWCEKERRHTSERLAMAAARIFADLKHEERQQLGVTSDELLRELRQKDKKVKRRYNDQREKETTNQPE